MVNKHMKRCSKSLIITDIQIKTTGYYLTPIRIATIKTEQKVSVGEDMEKLRPSDTGLGFMNLMISSG